MKKTSDTLFHGQVICKQYENGYRFSIDAVLLAHFPGNIVGSLRILDLCCGSGVIGFILAYRNPDVLVTGLEIQESMAQLAHDNASANSFSARYTSVKGDACCINQYVQPESFDLVFCNPPYRKLQTGRHNRSDASTIARHEIAGTLNDFIKAAAFSVCNRGRVFFVYPAQRIAPIVSEMSNKSLSVKKMQLIYSYPGEQSARLVLLEAVKNGGEQCEVLPPFYIYEEQHGQYTQEMATMYR